MNGGGASCGRCGCDLPAVLEVLRAAVVLLVQARSAMRKGAWDAALACATRSWALALRPQRARLAFLVAAAVSDRSCSRGGERVSDLAGWTRMQGGSGSGRGGAYRGDAALE